MTTITDFKLLEDDAGNDLKYQFRIGSSDDFRETMEAFKAAIPSRERKPFPDRTWLWEVTANEHNYFALTHLFDNFPSLYDSAKNQLTLWGKASKTEKK